MDKFKVSLMRCMVAVVVLGVCIHGFQYQLLFLPMMLQIPRRLCRNLKSPLITSWLQKHCRVFVTS